MRVLQRYDKISFKNNIVTEEFVITMMRDETLEDVNEGVKGDFERVNCTVNDKNCTVNCIDDQNERVNDVFERVNEQNERVNGNDNKSEDINFGVNDKSCTVNDKNCTVNDKNCTVNNFQQKILDLINENYHISLVEIAKKTEKSRRTVAYNLKQMKDKGIIERFGSDKTGGYRIINQKNKP